MNDQRIKLRPAQAAAFLDCSPASLWRWAKDLDGFPQPHALQGQRFTFWYQDELQAWKQICGEATRKDIVDYAWRRSADCSAMLRKNGELGQPFIAAYLLAGGRSLLALAKESGIGYDRIRRLARDQNFVTNIETAELFKLAVTQILNQEKELARELTAKPPLQQNSKFLALIDDLSQAHRLCFGQSLTDYANKVS